jgi:F-type H+-transporting ATPase subunit delta
MSSRIVATRYARALFDVSLKESSPEQVERELGAFVGLLHGHPELNKVLTMPGVPGASKRGVLEALSGRLGFSSAVNKLLRLLADRDRLALLPDLLDVFRERLMEHQQVIRAEVTTAIPLPADGASMLQKRLSDVTRQHVNITTRVDPSIIGGVIARIGSTVYDGSVAGQLNTLRKRLEERR